MGRSGVGHRGDRAVLGTLPAGRYQTGLRAHEADWESSSKGSMRETEAIYVDDGHDLLLAVPDWATVRKGVSRGDYSMLIQWLTFSVMILIQAVAAGAMLGAIRTPPADHTKEDRKS